MGRGNENWYDFIYEAVGHREKVIAYSKLKEMGYAWAGGDMIKPQEDAKWRSSSKYICATTESGAKIIRHGSSKNHLEYGELIVIEPKKTNARVYGGVI